MTSQRLEYLSDYSGRAERVLHIFFQIRHRFLAALHSDGAECLKRPIRLSTRGAPRFSGSSRARELSTTQDEGQSNPNSAPMKVPACYPAQASEARPAPLASEVPRSPMPSRPSASPRSPRSWAVTSDQRQRNEELSRALAELALELQ